MMTAQAFMPPVLPQPTAADLNGAANRATKSVGTNQPDEPADGDQDFLTTLNRISDRKTSGRCPSSSSETEKPVPADSLNRSGSQNQSPDIDDSMSGGRHRKQPVFFSPLLPIWMSDHALQPDTSASESIQPESTSDVTPSVFINFYNLIQSQEQGPFAGWLAEFDSSTNLNADISPQAVNFKLFEYFLARGLYHQAGKGTMDAPAGIFGSRNWMASGLESLLPGISESAGADPGAFSTGLLHLRKALLASMQSVQNTAGFENLEKAAGGEASNAIDAFLAKLANATQRQETDIAQLTLQPGNSSENKTGFGVPVSPGSEARIEMPLVQQPEENVPHDKLQAAVRTTEQPDRPIVNTAGVSTQSLEDGTGSKNEMVKDPLVQAKPGDNKVMSVESDLKDGGFSFAQDQMPEHLNRADGITRTTGAAQSSLSSQAMNQIVQKAVLSMSNGQSEVQIDLKPDFLGHVRMQIVSENHHVAIKIVTEFPFVKDMLETNFSQLKADLQAQGLQIDELEVSLAHDSNPREANGQKLTEASQRRSSGNDIVTGNMESDDRNPSQNRGAGEIGESAIDYFA